MCSEFEPAYVALHSSGELQSRAAQAMADLICCRACARECAADRTAGAGKSGCHTAVHAVVSSYHPHFGEEAPLVGRHGSGTIFFANCNLACQFCQNYEISQLGDGRTVEAEDLAVMMLQLQASGCHNVNLVSPSHVVPQILAGLVIAAAAGLRLPLVYNTGGYDALPTLALLDGVVDIYMPDMKFADEQIAVHWTGVSDYPAVNHAAVREMHRQVGDLELDNQGVARRGVLVRHLVLPAGLAGTAETVRFLAAEISRDTYLNIMGQYRPCHRAVGRPPLDRPPTAAEYAEAVDLAARAGLRRLDARLMTHA